ncbi:DUF427 domain-containing protein [Streptomyces sp. RB6PN25]|uniref:DUF427 domain-containing protein n=1 Tax=Streptomyces humicola TaxID=2953240 RepID=A0ABT1Q4B6_9ACTN|nr:DUF427 domain-containing protein [Streptomyces humicola]MCQ4084761.1 DUF427 domain-containing protein [Streptomyces humicola]
MEKREPGHRVIAVAGSQHVTVEIDGRVVADSRRPVLVYETGLPVRYYLPPEDVDLAVFEPTETHTTCPYKGVASYWTYLGDGAAEQGAAEAVRRSDVVWSYPDPLPDVAQIKGHLSFYDNVADVTVEGPTPDGPPDAPGFASA